MSKHLLRILGIVLAAICSVAASAVTARGEPTSDQLELFEKKIRPVLADRCYKCHSARSEKLKGGLLLDSREGLMRGGEDGPVVTPGNPEKSRLIEAVNYRNPDLQMPPKGKLPAEQIAALTEWVKMGAPWPKETGPAATVQKSSFDLEKRRREHWAWKQIQKPAVPQVKDTRWPANPVDDFLLAQLETNHLRPAPAAEPRILIRRLYFDLIGLPPSPDQVEDFVRDHSAQAYLKIVNRLLDSPQFGERWARHWLDLVRYAETLGHEFDYPIPNAWRYRDYVIRAFNADVPYDQFVTEHIAGDLLQNPRLNPAEHFNESIIGTGFFSLGQHDHSPVDVRQDQADIIDNEIDVMCKTFLGLTVACARCHDHKFDAIASKDFYSLYGILESSRCAQRAIDSPVAVRTKVRRLEELKGQIRHETAAAWLKESAQLAKYIVAANQCNSAAGTMDCCADPTNSEMDAGVLSRWLAALGGKSVSDGPLSVWSQFAGTNGPATPRQFQQRWDALVAEADHGAVSAQATNCEVFARFSGAGSKGWFPDGEAFVSGAGTLGDFVVGESNRPVAAIIHEPCADDRVVSKRLQGALRSPSFDIRRRYVHVLAAGRESRIRISVDNFALIRDPIYGGLKKDLSSDEPRWITFDLEMWKDHRAYIELCDFATPDPSEDREYAGNGFIAVSQVVFSDLATPPPASKPPRWLALFPKPPDSLAALALGYQNALREAILAWGPDSKTAASSDTSLREAQLAYLDWLAKNGLLDSPLSQSLKSLLAQYRETESSISEPTDVPAMADGDGFDERVFIRGSHKTPGEPAPRRFLTALSSPTSAPFSHGSGRLELARCMTDSSDPFLSRVMVNRVWLHLFGRGIVPTPDDFGALGQPPTHPQLLDWLADWYRRAAHWSTKSLIRLLVTSGAYRMSSKPDDEVAENNDPENLLFHRMPVRRLEGEVIRDAMLSVSGRLDATMFGPPVPIHLTEFMDGPGRPKQSGPLDGAGRRSVYIEVRRNFLSPMMRNFDAPVPFTTIGRRTVSNVPAQSLILLNDPFVFGQAQLWARRMLAGPPLPPDERLRIIYLMAFGHPPSKEDTAAALEFMKRQGASRGIGAPERWQDEKTWADLCHVMFNLKEFVFVE